VIDVRAIKSEGPALRICTVPYPTTVGGVKMTVKQGFPHLSQDTEMTSCSEICIWSVMAYFGNKYPEYHPIKFSELNEILKVRSQERRLPSGGLYAEDISYALKEFGFGVVTYDKSAYSHEFLEIIRMYVESGIPVIGILDKEENDDPNNGTDIEAHSVVIVGRETISDELVDELIPMKELGWTGGWNGKDELKEYKNNDGVRFYDVATIDVPYVYQDDNFAPYRKASLETPAEYYKGSSDYEEEWKNFRFDHIVVPLNRRVYLKPDQAKSAALALIEKKQWIKNKDILINSFLMSGRSLKHEIALDEEMPLSVRNLIMITPMPKFVWAMQLGTKDLYKKHLANGLILMDATEPTAPSFLMSMVEGKVLGFDGILEFDVDLQPFKSLQRNLCNSIMGKGVN